MKKLNQQKQIEVWEFRKLKKHPRQVDYFIDMSKEKIKAMAADIKARGLDHMIEILPNGTIISGHQRLRALKQLGYKEYKVIVRYDLAGADEFVMLNAFLASNAHRRDQDLLAQAKVALGLYEAENGGKVRQGRTKNARDYVGKMIGMSGRHLGRYWAILRTPLEVQEAFREHKLDVTMASKIGCLTDEYMNEIAKRIRNGEDPKVVAKDYLAPRKKREKWASAVVADGMKNLNLFVEQVGVHTDKLGPTWSPFLPVLKQAQMVIGQIVDRFAIAADADANIAVNQKESAVPNSAILSK